MLFLGLFYGLCIASSSHTTLTGVLSHPANALLIGIVLAISELRAPHMGIWIDPDGISLVSLVRTRRLRWSDIEEVYAETIPHAYRGEKVVRIRRRERDWRDKPWVRNPARLPTVIINPQSDFLGRWFGPSDLVGGLLRIPQDDVVDFLSQERERHLEASPAATAGPARG